MFADDTQLSHSESPDNYSDLVCSLQNCVKDIGLWMEQNKLKLNNDKTEAIRFSASSSVNTTFSPDVILCGWLGLKHQLTN